MKVYMHLNTFDCRAKFSTWLTRIAINSALMALRRKRAHPETSMDWSVDGETWQQWEIADKRENIEEHYARKEAGRRLTRAIHRLRPALRSIIEIQQSYDSSVKEIADVAGFRLPPLNRVYCAPELFCAGRYDLRRDRKRLYSAWKASRLDALIPLCSCNVRPSAKARSLRPSTQQPALPAACAPASLSRSLPVAASGRCAHSAP